MTNPAPKCEICGDPSFDGRRCRGCRAAMANPPLPADEHPRPSDTPPPLNTVDVAEGRRLLAEVKAGLQNFDYGPGGSMGARLAKALSESLAATDATIAERDALKAEVERLKRENAEAMSTVEGLGRLGETVNRFLSHEGHFDARGLARENITLRSERDRAVGALRGVMLFRDEGFTKAVAKKLGLYDQAHQSSGWFELVYANARAVLAAIQPKESGDA